MNKWIVTDTHFGHKMLVEEGHRPADYDARIMQRWKKTVQPGDIVIHLGDVALPDNVPELWQAIAALPGKLVLIRGNHDHRSFQWYMQRGVDFACDSFVWNGVLFTHEPALVVPDDIRINVHGHLHSGEHRAFEATSKHRLVSMEETNYAPMSFATATNPRPARGGGKQ